MVERHSSDSPLCVLGTSSGLDSKICHELVAHLKETKNVYLTALNGGEERAKWVRNIYNDWKDPEAASVNSSQMRKTRKPCD